MRHKPDQKARKKRREREAKRAAPASKKQKSPFTAKELFDKKRELIAKNRADLEQRLQAARQPVLGEYHRCIQAIEKLVDALPPGAKVESATLYPNPDAGNFLSDHQIVDLHGLLMHPANGWQVRLDPVDRKLIFRYDPYED